jgi:hypothetical protein
VLWRSRICLLHRLLRCLGLDCSFDAIRILDGVSTFRSMTNPLVASLCGNLNNALPEPFVLGPSVVIQFVTDSAGTALGFLGQFEAVVPSTCATGAPTAVARLGGQGAFGVYSDAPVDSTLPPGPVPAYVQGTTCTWVVTVDQPLGLPRYAMLGWGASSWWCACMLVCTALTPMLDPFPLVHCGPLASTSHWWTCHARVVTP